MGVWIETFYIGFSTKKAGVTPFVGVWIETPNNPLSKLDTEVTPFVGVWIETIVAFWSVSPVLGHTLRGCVD